MPYCVNCGKKLYDGVKFCNECGTPVLLEEAEKEIKNEKFYEEVIHKCPNCGETLNSFAANCPACGFEIRNIESSDSARHFEEKLLQIESKQLVKYEQKPSFMKTVFGKDFNNENTEDEIKKFEKQKSQEKIDLILNYPIPNTKEDLLEFALLVSSNIDTTISLSGNNDIEIERKMRKAWLSKLEQIYQKSKIVISSESDLSQISEIYYDVKKRITKRRNIIISIVFTVVYIWCVMAGIEFNTTLTIILAVLVALIVITILILIKLGIIGSRK